MTPERTLAASAVVLDDPSRVARDDGPKSLAYFCKGEPVRVDAALIARLKAEAARSGAKNVRLCLHESPGAAFHDMIIVEKQGKYYRPHKHAAKGESYHIIEGTLAAFVFDEAGGVQDACRLTPGGTMIYRVGAGMYHAVLPISELVVYHEAKPGPFLGGADSLYPAWAPDGTNPDDVAAFRQRLLRVLDSVT